MKKTSLISRYLLGFIFTVFGLNGFLQFYKMPPPTGTAAQFMGALVTSHMIAVIVILQIVSGVLLLINRFVPLALVILAPIIFNIILYHAFMLPSGLPLALFVTLLWILTAAGIWSVFSSLLRSRPVQMTPVA